MLFYKGMIFTRKHPRGYLKLLWLQLRMNNVSLVNALILVFYMVLRRMDYPKIWAFLLKMQKNISNVILNSTCKFRNGCFLLLNMQKNMGMLKRFGDVAVIFLPFIKKIAQCMKKLVA